MDTLSLIKPYLKLCVTISLNKKKSATQQKLLLPGPFYLGEEVNIDKIPSSDEAYSVNPNLHFVFNY